MDSAESGDGCMKIDSDNPSEILKTLDNELSQPVSLVLYGRGSIVRHDGITPEQMEPAFANVRMPDVVELHDAFARALPVVRGILDRHSG